MKSSHVTIERLWDKVFLNQNMKNLGLLLETVFSSVGKGYT